MNQEAKKRIKENLIAQDAILDLSRCGLNLTNKNVNELFAPLKDSQYLTILILGDNWTDFDEENETWKYYNAENELEMNDAVECLPSNLPTSLKNIFKCTS